MDCLSSAGAKREGRRTYPEREDLVVKEMTEHTARQAGALVQPRRNLKTAQSSAPSRETVVDRPCDEEERAHPTNTSDEDMTRKELAQTP